MEELRGDIRLAKNTKGRKRRKGKECSNDDNDDK